MRVLKILGCLFLFGAGFICGAASFVRTQARPLPVIQHCESTEDCLTNPEVLGLITSAGLHLAPGAMPDVVARSPECVGIRSPKPEGHIDLVFFPTRDVRNLLEITPDDEKYVVGCIALMRQVVAERSISDWRIVTNGPGVQEIDYLHFHLIKRN